MSHHLSKELATKADGELTFFFTMTRHRAKTVGFRRVGQRVATHRKCQGDGGLCFADPPYQDCLSSLLSARCFSRAATNQG